MRAPATTQIDFFLLLSEPVSVDWWCLLIQLLPRPQSDDSASCCERGGCSQGAVPTAWWLSELLWEGWLFTGCSANSLSPIVQQPNALALRLVTNNGGHDSYFRYHTWTLWLTTDFFLPCKNSSFKAGFFSSTMSVHFSSLSHRTPFWTKQERSKCNASLYFLIDRVETAGITCPALHCINWNTSF